MKLLVEFLWIDPLSGFIQDIKHLVIKKVVVCCRNCGVFPAQKASSQKRLGDLKCPQYMGLRESSVTATAYDTGRIRSKCKVQFVTCVREDELKPKQAQKRAYRDDQRDGQTTKL